MNYSSVTKTDPSHYTLAVVGDIHDQWSMGDQQALANLGVDLVLFVGDFGNESVPIVQQVADLPLPKAIAFGNHDAWYTASPWGRKKCPYDRQTDPWFEQQLQLLAPYHLNYRHLDFAELQLSIVGGRPFSWGGPKWHMNAFYQQWFGVESLEESRDRILESIQQTQYDHVIVLSHNGPTGLGDRPEDPCGKDWQPIGGDHGDPELEHAIAAIRKTSKRLSLVTFGHMHHRLRHTDRRIRTRLHQDEMGTLYLNAACVPRIKTDPQSTCHNFSLVTFQHHQIAQIESIWVRPSGEITESESLFQGL